MRKEFLTIPSVTTWAPLIFIFTITAVKEAADDLKRHKSDKQANTRLYTVVKEGFKEQVFFTNVT